MCNFNFWKVNHKSHLGKRNCNHFYVTVNKRISTCHLCRYIWTTECPKSEIFPFYTFSLIRGLCEFFCYKLKQLLLEWVMRKKGKILTCGFHHEYCTFVCRYRNAKYLATIFTRFLDWVTFLYHHFKTLADVLQFQDNYEILYNLSYFTRLVSLRL